MVQLRRILQMKELGLSNPRIKGILNLSRRTVDDYVNRLKQTGKSDTCLDLFCSAYGREILRAINKTFP